MAKFDDPSQLLEALSAPVGDLIAAVGKSVADAQQAMDLQSIENFLLIHREGVPALRELKGLGYRPTWYHIPEVNAELVVALTVTGEGERTSSTGHSSFLTSRFRLYAAPMDGTYTGKFNYDLTASTKIKFRIVPVPPSIAAAEMQVVPDLIGKTVSDARAALTDLRIAFAISEDSGEVGDDATIVSQEPGAGEMISGGVTLILGAE